MSDYPEHEKLSKVKAESQVIGEFLEWYGPGGGGVRARWLRVKPCLECEAEAWPDCPECEGEGIVQRGEPVLVPDSRGIQEILAIYFGIDRDALEEEKQSMLEQIRRAS